VFFNNSFYFYMILAFLVLMPKFLVYLWLPRAHVEVIYSLQLT
jgi:NADH:ubiquinone oxidoreductase subunit 4 (subunit M)